jgi:hypothetical protein
MLRKRMESSAPARVGGVQKQKILHRQLVRAHAHPQEAGKANKTVYAFFLDVHKRMIRSGGMGYPPSC